MKSKIKTLDELAHLNAATDQGITLVTGVYDILHVGHVELIEFASAGIHPVWVGLNSDAAVRQLKGDNRPINTFSARARVIAALMWVDAVFEIDDVCVAGAILDLAPLRWVKGGDYTMATLNKDEVAAAKAFDTEIVLFKSVPGYSTTNILKKLNG